jgi:two-component system, chemotaxis family, sensor kinase Cph1
MCRMANGVKQGDHICALFQTEEEQLSIAAGYVADGLRRGERCLYVTESAAGLERFREVLEALGVDTAAALKRGALVQATSAETHLAGGRFDAERMLGMLNDAVEAALNDGFQGLRTCGDMSWLLGNPEGADQVVEYEAFLNQFFKGVRATGMCLFDRARLPPALIDHALATHSSVNLPGRLVPNPFFEPAACGARAPRVEELESKLRRLQQ